MENFLVENRGGHGCSDLEVVGLGKLEESSLKGGHLLCLVRGEHLIFSVGPKLEVGTKSRDAVSDELLPGHFWLIDTEVIT